MSAEYRVNNVIIKSESTPGGGWYFGYIPTWVVKHWSYPTGHREGYREHPMWGHAAIESFTKRVKGKYYEYALVVLCYEHTHDDAILKRKLRR